MGKVEERLKEANERYERLKGSKNKGFITKDEQLVLKEGTLIHGTSFDETVLKSIAEKGLVGSNFTGFTNPNSNEKFPNGVNFFRVPANCFMKKYFEFYSNRRIDASGKLKQIKSMEEIVRTDGIPTKGPTHRKEYDFLPQMQTKQGTHRKDMAFIINPSQEIASLRDEDPYQKREKEFFDSEIAYNGYNEMFKNMKNRVGNILYGIPTSQISGILISPDFEKEIEQIEFLKKTFPDMYITTTEGKVIYRGLEKEEHIQTEERNTKSPNNQTQKVEDLLPQVDNLRKQMEMYHKGQSLLSLEDFNKQCTELGLEFNNEMQQARGRVKVKEKLENYDKLYAEEQFKLYNEVEGLGLNFTEELENAKARNDLRDEMKKFFEKKSYLTVDEINARCTSLGIDFNYEMQIARDGSRTLPIATDSKDSTRKIASRLTVSEIKQGITEVKESYIEFGSPEQESGDKSLDE